VDVELGAISGITRFLGAMIGGHVMVKGQPRVLGRVFIAVVIGLAFGDAFQFREALVIMHLTLEPIPGFMLCVEGEDCAIG
jgi:hypothetical protein